MTNTPITDGYYVSGHTVVLSERHDARQLWFDFGHTVIFQQDPEHVRKPVSPQALAQYNKQRKNEYAEISPHHRDVMYRVERGVEQYPLPFWEWRVVTSAQKILLMNAGYPCFERDSEKLNRNGKPRLYRLIFRGGQRGKSRLGKLLRDILGGRAAIHGSEVTFEKRDDYLMAIVTGEFS